AGILERAWMAGVASNIGKFHVQQAKRLRAETAQKKKKKKKLSLRINDISDCARLQEDIDRVVKWSEYNRLQFNTRKCAVMTFSRACAPVVGNYIIDVVPMTRVVEVKDLGRILIQKKKKKEKKNIIIL
ncbi:jg12200, partial [Pararge aegeria aegeria]